MDRMPTPPVAAKPVAHASYEPPRIVHKGQLKQFAGSPLAIGDGDPLDVLGLSD